MHLSIFGFTILPKVPEEVDLVVEEEADEGVEDVSLDDEVKELLEVLVVAKVIEVDVGEVKVAEDGVIEGGEVVSWSRLVVVTATIGEEIGVELSVAEEVL